MKRFISSIGQILLFPKNLITKIKINTFLGGLILGAVFSLLVNIVTVKVQEDVNKQRILEALENEILNNTMRANNIAENNRLSLDNKKPYNPFYYLRRYSKDLWEQSTEPLQYVAQLDQDTQIAISGYYSIMVPSLNGTLDNLERLAFVHLQNCSPIDNKLDTNESETCQIWNEILLDTERSVALDIGNDGINLLKKFHPTKDRLDSWFLKLVMGDKSMRVLSGE